MKIPQLKFKKSRYLALVAGLALVLIITFVNYANAQTPLTRDSGARVGDNQNSQAAGPNAIGMQMTDNQRKDKLGNQEKILTNRQGHPVYDNQNTRTVGDRGPTVLENYNFLEKITHFDRERIPERVVHARGAGAHGFFEAYGKIGDEPVSKYTRAKLFQQKGKITPTFVRFSTVVHGAQSPETLRDPRGFATKFYTEDGNWDLVGNDLKVFFIRRPLQKYSNLVWDWLYKIMLPQSFK